ncbi:MAG: anti-sigma factor family protein [Planctomycetota bacterium]
MQERESCPRLAELHAYLDGALSPVDAEAVREHLSGLCSRCEQNLELLEWAREAGTHRFEAPPPEVMERARAIPRGAKARPRRRARLIYDSAGGMLATGVRAPIAFERRQIWSAADLEIEIQLEPQDEQGTLLIGQIRGSGKTGEPRLAEVILRRGDSVEAKRDTDDEGEFLFCLSSRGDRHLEIRSPGGDPIEIPLEV